MAELKINCFDFIDIKQVFINMLVPVLMNERHVYLEKKGHYPDIIIIPEKFIEPFKLHDIKKDEKSTICGLTIRFSPYAEKFFIYNEMLCMPKIDFNSYE